MTAPLDEARRLAEIRTRVGRPVPYTTGTVFGPFYDRDVAYLLALIADREHGEGEPPIPPVAHELFRALQRVGSLESRVSSEHAGYQHSQDIVKFVRKALVKARAAIYPDSPNFYTEMSTEAVGEPDLRAAREMLPSDETPCDLEITASELTGWRYDRREGELSLYLDGEEGMTLVVVPVAPVDLPILDAVRARIAALAAPAVLRDEDPVQ